MSLKETAIKLTCVVVMLACFVQTASADWYDDLKPNSTWVEIEGENFVADTFMGVKALYNENNRNHQCGDLVIRFYKEAYGLDIYPYGSGGPSSETGGYRFVKTSSPKAGDIIYVSKEMRGSDQDHWAIVRDYSDGYITMFEQNVRWDGKAVVGRKIKYPSDSYYVYTLVKADGSSALNPDETEKTTAEQTTNAPETTVTETTEAVTAVVTTKPATTAVITTKPQTTSPQTTKATIEETTVELTEEITEEYTVPVSGVDSAYSELNTTAKATQPQTVKESTTAKQAEEDNGKVNPVLLAAGACAVLVAVAAVVMVIAKKKRK